MRVEDDCGPGLNSCGDGRPGCPSQGEARRARSMLKPGRNSTAAHPVASGSARCGDSGAPCRARKTRVGRQLGTRAPLWRPVNL